MRTRPSILACLVVVLLVSPVIPPASAGGSVDANKQLVRRFTDELYNQRKKDRIEAYVHPDFVDHSPGTGPESRGIDYVKDQWERNYAAFPDLRFELLDVLAEGDKVVARWKSDGTFSGTLSGATGHDQNVSVQGVSIFRIQDGKMIESWDFVDRVGMLLQSGFKILPPEKPAADK